MCDETTPKQLMHSVYPWGPYQDVLFPEVLPPDVQQQNGYNLYVYGAKNNGTGPDRHRFCVNKDNGIDYEEYNPYTDSHNPVVRPGHVTTLEFDTNVIRELRTGMAIQLNHVTGACQSMNWTGAGSSSFPLTITSQQPATNGYAKHVVGTIAYDSSACPASDFSGVYFASGGSDCQFCNVGTMMAWPNYDNSIYGGTDAAGTSLVATSIDPNQWYHNVVDNIADPTTGRVEAVSHLLRTTFVNAILSPRNQGIAVTGNQVTYNHPLMSVSCVARQPDTMHFGNEPGDQRLRCLRRHSMAFSSTGKLSALPRALPGHLGRTVGDAEQHHQPEQRVLRDHRQRHVSLHNSCKQHGMGDGELGELPHRVWLAALWAGHAPEVELQRRSRTAPATSPPLVPSSRRCCGRCRTTAWPPSTAPTASTTTGTPAS